MAGGPQGSRALEGPMLDFSDPWLHPGRDLLKYPEVLSNDQEAGQLTRTLNLLGETLRESHVLYAK